MHSQTPSIRPRWSQRQRHAVWLAWIGALAPLFLLMACLMLLTWPARAAGPTEVSGVIDAPTTWTLDDSPYIVTGTVTVEGSGVLTIEAGVLIRFDQGTELRIRSGPLVTLATAEQPITLTANLTPGVMAYWNGITFDDTSAPSILRYCLVEYAGTGVAVGGDTDYHRIDHCTFRYNGDGGNWDSGGAINSAGDVLTITNNLIYDNELGIRLRKSYRDTITGNRIYDNDGFGIGFMAANSPGGDGNLIAGNEIYGNGGFGVGFVGQDTINTGGSQNQVIDNRIYDTVAAGGYQGVGIYLNIGSRNWITGNLILGNAGHGIWTRSQSSLRIIENIVRANGLDGVAYATPNAQPAAFHSNVLCSNGRYDLENLWPITLVADGNWFGTNEPADGSEISGPVDYSPWISMTVAAAPPVLPADGISTAVLTLTMSSGTYHVPDGYTVTVSASEGSVLPPVLTLFGGQDTATYTAGTTPGGVDVEATDQCATLIFTDVLTLQAVDLAAYKEGPGGTARPGDTITYTVTISELGGVDALNVEVSDILPAGTSWLSDTGATCGLVRVSTAPEVVWTAPLWPGGESCSFELAVLVGGDACQAQRLENTVSVTSTVTDLNPANNTWTTTDDSPAMLCLDLAVSKTDGGVVVGPNKEYFVEYTVVVSNVGAVTATAVVLTDVLPVEATYEDGDWTCSSGLCNHFVDTLNPTDRVELPLLVQLDKNALSCPIELTNRVEVGRSGDLDTTNNVFTLNSTLDCLPDLVVVLNDNVGREPDEEKARLNELLSLLPEEENQRPCVFPGEWITYLIGYVNTGLVTATEVVLTETVPAYTTYMGYGWDCNGATCTRQVGDLPPNWGGAARFAVRVDTAPPDLSVEDEVRIGGAEEDMYPPDNVSTDDTPICEGLWLQITKDDNTPCAFPGDEIRYTIVFTNPSGESMTGVVLTETLPAHTSYLTSPGWISVGGGQYVYNYGPLAPFASDSVEFVVMVDDPLDDTVTETINEVCMGYDGPTPPGNCYTLITPLPLVPDLRVLKHDHIGLPPPRSTLEVLDRFHRVLDGEPYQPPTIRQFEPVKAGDIFSYTIGYVNLGRRPATGVVLTETLPAYTTYVGYGWTHIGGNTYTYEVGTLNVGQGGWRQFWVQVGLVPCNGDDYLYNWVHIGGNEEECNLGNNWSGEETPVECSAYFSVYLPLVLKDLQLADVPTPTPSPTPTHTPTPTPTPTPLPTEGYVSDVAVNPETGLVYVASPQVDAVFAVDPSGDGSIIATIPVGDHPLGLAVVTTTNKIYAANLHSWTLTAINGQDHSRIKDIYVGAQACKVAADSGDARVYVTNHLESDNGAAAVNSQTDEFLYYYNRLHATQGRYGIDVDTEAENLFIAARDAGLIAIQDAYSPDAEPQIFKLDPPRVPFVVAFNPTTGHLFVTAADDNLVVVLDPYSIQWNRGRWITWLGRPVFLLDQLNAGWIKEIGVGLGAEEGIAVNPLTGYVYVTNADSDTLSVIKDDADPTKIHWIMDVAVGEHPQGVDVDIKTNYIYVGNAWSRDLTVIDGADHSFVKTIPLE